ncbi:MAG: hypothetical protein E7260_00930 [Lachnospiraceae bacterium]|nr:hypothetical protein [Lachnospiraceae bacterium]
MQTQHIINTATGSMFFATASANTSGKTLDGVFAQMFQTSSEKYETLTAKDGQQESQINAYSTEIEAQKVVSKEFSGKSTEVTESGKTEETVTTESVDEKEMAERVAGLVVQVTELVKELLEVSQEEMQGVMDLLGMTETDLLNVDMLKQMVLKVNGEQDATAFLMNNDLLAQMQQLLAEVETLMEESGIAFSELMEISGNAEFGDWLKQALSELTGEQNADESEPETQPETVATESEKELTISFEAGKAEESAAVTTVRNEKSGNWDMASEHNATEFANHFIQSMEQAVADGISETSFRADLTAQIREIAAQILEQVKMVVTPEMTSLEIQLTPEELGKVNVTVTEQDGVMKARFVTENEIAKEAIESNLVQFKQMMNEQGLKVESIEVTVSEFAFDKNGEAGRNQQEDKKHGKARFVMEEENGPTAMQDELARHFMEGGESTVNYMA